MATPEQAPGDVFIKKRKSRPLSQQHNFGVERFSKLRELVPGEPLSRNEARAVEERRSRRRVVPMPALVAAEQFGPVLPIVPFDTEDDAVAMANDSEYGLAASVWSQDDEHAFAVAARIEAGTVFVNVHRSGASDHTTPFGGVKQSGIGRSNGWAPIEELTETQMLIRRDYAASLPGPPPA